MDSINSPGRFLKIFILLVLCLLRDTFAAAPPAVIGDTQFSFSPCDGMSVIAKVTKQALTLSIDLPGQVPVEQSVPLDIERQPHLVVDDYNFDGRPDISVWYVDEGMGTSTVHRVFLFNPGASGFTEAVPHCGEEFLNLKVDKAKRVLISTFYREGKPSLCRATSLGRKAPHAVPQVANHRLLLH